jgi:hypothetical protein
MRKLRLNFNPVSYFADFIKRTADKIKGPKMMAAFIILVDDHNGWV